MITSQADGTPQFGYRVFRAVTCLFETWEVYYDKNRLIIKINS